jgi:hypothetical protein
VNAVPAIVRSLDAGTSSALDSLVRAFPFRPYRHYRAYSRKAQHAILHAEIAAASAEMPSLGAHAADGAYEVAVVARPLPWDSAFFGVRMARIEYVLHTPDAPADLLHAALGATLDACRVHEIPHVSARVDVEDISTVALLERAGFRLMDSLVTYRMRPQKAHPVDVRSVGTIRDFEAPDTDDVMDIARESFQGYRGRFQHDAHVPAARAEAFYLEWTRACIEGRMADKGLVSVNSEGRVIGYLFFRRREPASTVGGIPLFGGGIGACRRDSPGAYASLIRAATLWSHEHGSIAETQTQNYNFPVIRVYEAAGAHYVRAEYTLHAWLAP